MRIMMWAELFAPYIGGLERMTEYLLRGLVARGHEPFIVTNQAELAREPETTWEGIPLYRLPVSLTLTRKDLGALSRLTARVTALRRQHRPDLAHVQVCGPMGVIHAMTNRTSQVPTVMEPHMSLLRIEGYQALGRAFDAADTVVAITGVMEEDIRTCIPTLATPVYRIPYGVPMPGLASAPLPLAPPVLLALGRLIHEKGVDLVLDAYAQLRQILPDLRLIIAGDGPERAALETQAATLGVADGVEFSGWVEAENVPALINRATVVVLPSRCEDVSPVVIREAAQMARPTVAADVGGVAELVQHGKTGLLCAREDATALAEAIRRLLESPSLLHTMGQDAYAHAVDAYGLDRYIDAHVALYQELVTHASQSGRTWETA